MKKVMTGSAALRSQARGVIHLNDNVYKYKQIASACFALAQGAAKR